MGEISIGRQHLDRLLTDSAGTYGTPYQRSFAEFAGTHRASPPPRSCRSSGGLQTTYCSASQGRTCKTTSGPPSDTGMPATFQPTAANTRQEVLLAEAVVYPEIGPGCTLTGGTRRSYYDEREMTPAGALGIDHFVSAPATAWSRD
ncbi:hypothetical protein [Streptomyces sp. NBC_01310]|uniref:hypothetical protein n=1 Tax=Streptomyces sp. NBC_01310 TaxID=2903820 RepID=UPI0035B656B2